MNPLNTSVQDLFNHLNRLNGLLFTLGNHLSNFEKLFRESISKTSFDISTIYSGASIPIRDLTEWPESGLPRYYSSGLFTLNGEEYLDLIKELLARESAWTISQAYEAFEKFLKDISATLLLENQQLAETKKVKKFESEKKNNNLTKTDIAFWRNYLDYHYKKNTDKLKFLRKICPDISKGEKENNREIDLTDWFAVVEEVRHSATHSNFIIKPIRMKIWTKAKLGILKEYFPGINIEQGYRIDITRENATFCLQLFSEYSFRVYKFLSISRGYDWNILQKKKEE
ncbi:MAG: hypothetical protein WCU00_05995 [Candidatus Latescibacterota bacterium]